MPIIARARRAPLLAVLLAGVAALPAPALAQAAPAATPPTPAGVPAQAGAATGATDTTSPPTQGSPVADEPAAGADRLEDVTVVARKRAENAQAVPIPITVISPQELTTITTCSTASIRTAAKRRACDSRR